MDARAQGVVLHGEPSAGVVLVADEGVGFTLKTSERGVVDPRLLDELELAFNVAVEADEVQAALSFVFDERIIEPVAV